MKKLFAFALCSINAESFDFIAFKKVLSNNLWLANTVFALTFAGFATKKEAMQPLDVG